LIVTGAVLLPGRGSAWAARTVAVFTRAVVDDAVAEMVVTD
jgi:hypothetical protein